MAMRSYSLAVVMLVYLISSWILLELVGEHALTRDMVDYLYFMATTGSTVGYGDISPATPGGRLVASFWLYPGGILIFSLVVGKIGTAVVERMQKMAKGLADYSNIDGATVLIGYHPDRTPMMIDNLIAGKDGDRDIILISNNPNTAVRDSVRFVFAERLDSEDALARAAIDKAAKVLIYGDSDAESLNAALAVRERNKDAHVVAFFLDRATGQRAERIAHVSAVVSMSSEMVVRAAQDPGAEKVVMALARATEKSTIYSNEIPTGNSLSSGVLSRALYDAGAVMTARQALGKEEPEFLPFDGPVNGGDIVYYIAQSRLSDAAFNDLLGSVA